MPFLERPDNEVSQSAVPLSRCAARSTSGSPSFTESHSRLEASLAHELLPPPFSGPQDLYFIITVNLKIRKTNKNLSVKFVIT